MSKISVSSLLLSISFWLVFANNCSATNLAAKTNTALFSTSNIKPWGFINNKNQEEGLLIDFNKALAHESGIKITNHVIPYPRVIREIKNGDVDFAIMFKNPQAESIGISLGQVAITKIVLVALTNNDSIKSLAQLAKQPVGYLRGSKFGQGFDNNTDIKKVPLGSIEQGINLLVKNRIKAIVCTERTFYGAAKLLNIKTNQIKPVLTIKTVAGDLYFSKNSPNTHLIEPIKNALTFLNQTGRLAQIFNVK